MSNASFFEPHYDNERPLWMSPIALYTAAVVLMFTLGPLFQQLFGMHLGVLVMQVVVVFGTARVYRHFYKGYSNIPVGDQNHWIGLKRLGITPGIVLLNIAAAISLGFTANLLGAITVELIPSFAEMAEAYRESVEGLVMEAAWWEQLLGIAAITIAAPFLEEYLFRGTMLPEQGRRSGMLMAVLMNGLLFSLMHANPIALLPLMVVGIYLAQLTVKTWSLWPAVIAHAALNTVNGVILPRLVRDMPQPEEMAPLGELLITGIAAGSLSAILWWAVFWRINKMTSQQSMTSVNDFMK